MLQLVKERQFSKYEDWRFTIKGEQRVPNVAAEPRCRTHVLRHTFCTNMQQAGIDIKSLQYLMGHSNASVTLDVYTHTDYNVVKRAFVQAAANL